MKETSIASLLVAAFAIGCAVAPVMVPRMNAQTSSRTQRWEYTCYGTPGEIDINLLNEHGAAGWELTTGPTDTNGVFCLKRAL